MSETFANQTFNAGQASTGLFLGNTFTGTDIASGASSITISGNVDLPGSSVTVDANLVGLVGAGLSGTYVGFSQPPGEVEPTYFFSVSPGGLQLPVTVAVSAGQLTTLSLLASVNTDAVTAPDSPTIVCFATGTRIRTPEGDVRVENLNVGDLVLTASGAQRPIRWIGHRTIACEGRSDLAQVLPVRIARDAFGEGRPARDLLVSPARRSASISSASCSSPPAASSTAPRSRRSRSRRSPTGMSNSTATTSSWRKTCRPRAISIAATAPSSPTPP